MSGERRNQNGDTRLLGDYHDDSIRAGHTRPQNGQAMKDSQNGHARKALHIRTPLIESGPLSTLAGCEVLMKMENMQPTGSFKLRGSGRSVQMAKAEGYRRIVASSGGNSGVSAAYCCKKEGLPITLYVPTGTPSFLKATMEFHGATVICHGDIVDHSNAKAKEVEAENPETTKFVHPTNGQNTWDGHSTLVHELADDLDAPPDLIVISVGSGGLLSGVCQGLQDVGWEDTPILCMETVGADCFHQSVKAGGPVTLPASYLTSVAKCLTSAAAIPKALEYYKKHRILSEVVTDKEAVHSCFRFLDDHRVLVEPACGATLAAFYCGVLTKLQNEGKLGQLRRIVVVICGGAGVELNQLLKWKEECT